MPWQRDWPLVLEPKGGFCLMVNARSDARSRWVMTTQPWVARAETPAARENADGRCRPERHVRARRHRLATFCGALVVGCAMSGGVAVGQTTPPGTDTGTGSSSVATPLTVQIVTPASGASIPSSGQISFAANKAGVTFLCQLGASAARAPCTPPVSYGPLTVGDQFVFVVVATAPNERTSTARAIYSVAATSTPLQVKITSAPSGKVTETSGTISFEANRPGATFRCTIDGAAIAQCASPQGYSTPALGTHVFTVVAVLARRASEPQQANWTVTSPGPLASSAPRAIITSAPSGTVHSTTARVTFTARPAAAGFRCSLDRKAFGACASPRVYHHLARRSHTFRVRAIGGDGRAGPTVTTSWKIAAAVPPESSVPSPSEPAADGTPTTSLLLVIGGLAALLALAAVLVTRRVRRARRRIAWQLRARREPPERPCKERSHYCQKTEIKLKPGRRHIAYLEVHAHNGDRDALSTTVSDRVVDALNSALRGYRHHHERDELQRSVAPAADQLVREIESWLGDDTSYHGISTDAHLTASAIDFTFTLYRCSKKNDGPEWEEEDEWEASLDDEVDETVAELRRPQPRADEVESAAVQLADFVSRVDHLSTLTAPSEATLKR
jgi:hypothetical protein